MEVAPLAEDMVEAKGEEAVDLEMDKADQWAVVVSLAVERPAAGLVASVGAIVAAVVAVREAEAAMAANLGGQVVVVRMVVA